METKKNRPVGNPGRDGPTSRNSDSENKLPFNSTTQNPQMSRELAQRIFHDLYVVLERKPVPLVHLPDPRPIVLGGGRRPGPGKSNYCNSPKLCNFPQR